MKKRYKLIFLALLFIVVFVSSAIVSMNIVGSAPQKLFKVDWDSSSGKIYKDLNYKNNNGNKYDLYIPTGLDKSKDQQLILYIHGGSFNSGSKEDGEAWSIYYASHGYITASIDYTLQMKGLEADLNLMTEEIKSGVNAIYEEVSQLGYNINGMALSGVSAGGTLAMNYAYRYLDTSTIPVRFVFQLAAPADFEPKDWSLLKKINGIKTDKEFVEIMTGYKITEKMIELDNYDKYIDTISPARLVNKDSVPTLLGYGLNDSAVPANSKNLLLDALEENNVPYDYIEFPNSNHGMYSDLDKLSEFLSMSLEYAKKYFK